MRFFIHLDPDLLKQNLLSAINDGIALHNSELVERWTSRLAVYPNELAMAMIRTSRSDRSLLALADVARPRPEFNDAV